MQQNFLFRNCSALALSITIALSLSTSLYAKPSSKPAFRKDDASDLKDATTARMVLEKSKTFLDTVPFYLPKAADLPASGRLQTKAKRLYDLLKSISEQKPTATPDGIATQITALESAVNKLKDTPEANKKEKVNSGELLKTAKSANETYTKLVTSLTEYGKGIVSELQNRITAEKLPVDTDTGEVKTSKLAQNLADWIDAALAGEILVSNSLTPDWLQIQKNEAAAFQTSFKTNVLDKLAGWLDAPTEVANSVATSVEAFIATKTYAKASLQIFEGYLATIKQVENVIDAWFFAPSSFKKSSATPTREIEVKLDALRLARVKARGQIAIFSEIITGERSQWKTVQARLYYYDKPQQLVKILNDNAQMLEPNAPNLKQQSDAAYNALFNMESEVYVKRHQIELKNQERLELEERLRKVKTVATAAQTQLADGKKLQSLYNEYKALPDTPVAAKESAKQKFEKERNKYTQKYGVYLDSQNIDAHVSALEEANAKAQGELNGLQDSASGLPTQIKALNEDIVRLQGDILVQTRRIALDARREAQLFGEMRDGSGNVLYTSPVPGTTDPGKKVALYASEGSRTITIRGKEEDIAQVREIIAEFDRPAPQARISIWKIQINGSNNNSLNKAIYETDKKLLQIRQSINRAQDILRNAVTSEVSRTAAAAKQTMKLFRLKESTSPTSQSDDRLARYFYYPKEIRRKLGFVLARNPKTEEELEKAFVKFDVASKLRRALTLLDSKSVALANIYFQSAWEQMRYLNDKSLLYDRMKDLNAAIHNEKSLLAPGGERSEELNQFLASQEKTIGCLKTQLECWISNIKPDSCDVLPIDINDAAYVTSWTLPEPTRVTTLGEALFSLSLGRRTSRSLIIHEFMAQLDSAFTLPARSEGGSYVAQLNAMRDSVLAAYRRGVNVIENHTLQFPKMIFGGNIDDPLYHGESIPAPDGALGTHQGEMLLAITSRARTNVAREVQRMTLRIAKLDSSGEPSQEARQRALNQYLPLIGWLSATFSPQAALTPLPTGTRGYWYTAGQAAISFLETIPERRLNITLPNAPQADAAFMKMAPKTAWQIAETQLQRDPLSQSTARIAAVDDLLKRMIVAIEDDFDRFFVQPLLQDMRVIVNRSKVDFGVIQRTSILATNRMVARVDTNASANANIQTQQDFLQQATQLAQIGQGIGLRNVARAAEGAATAYTASKLAFNGSGKDLGSLAAGIISLFNGLATLPQDPGEIYSVNSGDLIQVTPIFDPSGQALRFKFDFAGTVNVQEPNGTRTRQLPRVERHTINTEVQLSNLELREISRFETNSKIGVPERRSGGIPLLKELNYIKDIPLIGYFVRQAGSAAIRQESLILGQTTIYPTIAEIIDLLLESSRGRANETPDELK